MPSTTTDRTARTAALDSGGAPRAVLIHFPQWSAHASSMSHYCDLLVEGLSRRGYTVRILSKQSLLAATSPGLRRHLLQKTPAILSTWPTLFRERFKRERAWIVNISQEYVPPFGASRSINIIHDLIQIDYPRSRVMQIFYRHLLPPFSRRAALNISVSRTTAARLDAMGIASRVVYNTFSVPDSSAPASRKAADRPYAACWVGTAAKHKNVADFLGAVRQMPEARFAAIMPEREAKLIKDSLSLPENLTIFSSLDPGAYACLLGDCRYLVSTSLAEGFGRPPADGALAGCDLVLSDIPIYRELYEGLAHFYRPGDVGSLVKSLELEPCDIQAHALARLKEWNSQHDLVDIIDRAIGSH